MSSRRQTDTARDVAHSTISRRRLLAGGGAVAVGCLAGCVNRVASSVTNTGASPAAVFAGVEWNDDETEIAFIMAPGSPHVTRLTPTVSSGVGVVELEGWVTSSAVMAQDYNSSRSNKQKSEWSDDDSDGDGVSDVEEDDDELVAYLGGEPIVGERFTVCLPDAEVPGRSESIAATVTPDRLIAYLTGDDSFAGLAKADSKKSRGGGDCDDDDTDIHPGAVCGTTPHFVAEVTGPVATGGGLEAVRTSDGVMGVVNSPTAEGGASVLVCPVDGDAYEPDDLSQWGRAARDVPTQLTQQGRLVSQAMVQPPGCPRAFPALFYVSRVESDDQLVYTGGWVIDDAALYEDSETMLTMAGPTQVVGIECCFDYSEAMSRAVSGERARRGARIDSGTSEELVKAGVLSSRLAEGIRKRPGRERYEGEIELKHVAVDAPVLHLTSASRASQDVKFKAGAELSKSVK